MKADFLENAKQPLSVFPLVSASTMTDKPAQIEWLVDNFIEKGSLNLLFGEPASGKSLFALDWAFCIAAGLSWHDFDTQQSDVLIIAGEGFTGLKRRLKALECKYNTKAPESLYISKQPSVFNESVNAAMVAQSIKEICPNPGLVIFDTLHRNSSGDENSSKDIGEFIGNIDAFLKPSGCAVLIVHHSGHGQKDRSRGSSAIKAAMDGEFSVIKDEAGVTIACTKAKDFEPIKPLNFSLKITDLDGWIDQKTRLPMTSVYLDFQGEAKRQKKKISASDSAVMQTLYDAIAKHGTDPTSELKDKFSGFSGLSNVNRKVVCLDHWRQGAYLVIDADNAEAKKKSFQRSRKTLFDNGLIANFNDFYWPTFKDETTVTPGRDGTKRDIVPACPPISRDGTGHYSKECPDVPVRDTKLAIDDVEFF
jgi:RecA-family ATPase